MRTRKRSSHWCSAVRRAARRMRWRCSPPQVAMVPCDSGGVTISRLWPRWAAPSQAALCLRCARAAAPNAAALLCWRAGTMRCVRSSYAAAHLTPRRSKPRASRRSSAAACARTRRPYLASWPCRAAVRRGTPPPRSTRRSTPPRPTCGVTCFCGTCRVAPRCARGRRRPAGSTPSRLCRSVHQAARRLLSVLSPQRATVPSPCGPSRLRRRRQRPPPPRPRRAVRRHRRWRWRHVQGRRRRRRGAAGARAVRTSASGPCCCWRPMRGHVAQSWRAAAAVESFSSGHSRQTARRRLGSEHRQRVGACSFPPTTSPPCPPLPSPPP